LAIANSFGVTPQGKLQPEAAMHGCALAAIGGGGGVVSPSTRSKSSGMMRMTAASSAFVARIEIAPPPRINKALT